MGGVLEWEGRWNNGMSNSVTTAFCASMRGMAIGKTKATEKSDRATVEQAINPRTRMVLFKMLNRDIFHDINGCISTGKEANVYHATKPDGKELAVYKTSALNSLFWLSNDWIGTQNVVHVEGGLIELYRSKHVPEDQRMIVR
ncbi:hypothetical protein M8C21_007820 [Ambrosia artemisiifolia]|uniref:Uncharacterized protein n=1 Tax=Ambrosia artemisiifolia TaxID=4212 RepID=A0AAD5GRT0_AMBAR|nr:hypothetical protein M8C21_007820 [Ambrosia artemisiifolia]